MAKTKTKTDEKVAELKLTRASLKDLQRLPGVNPNRMSEHDYEALKQALASSDIGYLQPFLISIADDGSQTLVDGEHRVKALLELGYTHADVVAAPEKSARLLRLSMHLRGQSDDELVAKELHALVEEGYSQDTLSELTPFEEQELENLLSGIFNPLVDLDLDTKVQDTSASTNPRNEDALADRPMQDESTFNITLRFISKMDRDRVSQTLRDHGITPEDGILTLLGLK